MSNKVNETAYLLALFFFDVTESFISKSYKEAILTHSKRCALLIMHLHFILNFVYCTI